MQKWEYCRLSLHGQDPVKAKAVFYKTDGKNTVDISPELTAADDVRDAAATYMAKMGLDGWELVSASDTIGALEIVFYFKRPLE
ncbi:MAG: hypothetical protein WBF08_01415 [Candidatus Bathyarchaeia archaeon]|nr:MAG: hypothetical protein A3K80_05430 [Candidatus Bathyarchaeota archaeon RBG_13_38_9]